MRKAVLHRTTAFLLATLGIGCGTQQETPEPKTAAAVQRAAMEEEFPEEELALTLAQRPPRVEEMFVTPLEALNEPDVAPAELSVRFHPDLQLPSQIEISTDDWQRVVLSNSGNNVFTGVLAFDFRELEWQYQRFEMVRDEFGDLPMPRFEGRQIVEGFPPRWDPEWFRNKLQEGSPFRLDDVYGGFPQLVAPPRSLFVNHSGVVGDPTRTSNVCNPQPGDANKVWSFGYLMTQLANESRTGIPPAEFARNWLEKWRYDRYVNGWSVPARNNIDEIIQQWENASGGFALDMDKAPFKLLAIVNRIDLAENSVYGGGNAGEGRFIFAWVDSNCETREFTVIFEYGVPLSGCMQLRDWAQQWKLLDTMTPGTPAFNAHLESITQVFAQADAAWDKPNGSALNQLRTNEIALAGPWQLREFRFLGGDGFLWQTTVVQTPDTSLNETPVLADYVNQFEVDILNDRHVVPLLYQGGSFRGGSSDVVPDQTFHWRAEGINNNEARHKFAVNTCNGCHARETGTNFTHINVHTRALSRFLTGNSMPIFDPVDGTPRTFGDLDFRAARLDSIAHQMCLLRIKDFRSLVH